MYMYGTVNVHDLSMTSVGVVIHNRGAYLSRGALIRMGALIGIGELIYKNTF